MPLGHQEGKKMFSRQKKQQWWKKTDRAGRSMENIHLLKKLDPNNGKKDEERLMRTKRSRMKQKFRRFQTNHREPRGNTWGEEKSRNHTARDNGSRAEAGGIKLFVAVVRRGLKTRDRFVMPCRYTEPQEY